MEDGVMPTLFQTGKTANQNQMMMIYDTGTSKLKWVSAKTFKTLAFVPYGTPNIPSTYPSDGVFDGLYFYVGNADNDRTVTYNGTTGAYVSETAIGLEGGNYYSIWSTLSTVPLPPDADPSILYMHHEGDESIMSFNGLDLSYLGGVAEYVVAWDRRLRQFVYYDNVLYGVTDGGAYPSFQKYSTNPLAFLHTEEILDVGTTYDIATDGAHFWVITDSAGLAQYSFPDFNFEVLYPDIKGYNVYVHGEYLYYVLGTYEVSPDTLYKVLKTDIGTVLNTYTYVGEGIGAQILEATFSGNHILVKVSNVSEGPHYYGLCKLNISDLSLVSTKDLMDYPFNIDTTSTTSLTVAEGMQTLTVEPGLALSMWVGIRVDIIQGDWDNYLGGSVVSYDVVTGELVVDVDDTFGSGTYAAWSVSAIMYTQVFGNITSDDTYLYIITYDLMG